MPDPEAESFRPGSPEHEDPGADAVMRLYLEEAIGGLPDRERAILELLYFEGKTASEVAEALGLGAGTVLTLRNSALRKIRDDLATRQAGGGGQVSPRRYRGGGRLTKEAAEEIMAHLSGSCRGSTFPTPCVPSHAQCTFSRMLALNAGARNLTDLTLAARFVWYHAICWVAHLD